MISSMDFQIVPPSVHWGNVTALYLAVTMISESWLEALG